MGVHGLWQLLHSAGHPVSLESLAGKVLGIDVSMWLHQASKGMRDRHGNAITNAHLVVLFRRICKLLYYRIKPVFVFDGGIPILKQQTLAQRRRRREDAVNEADLATKKLISKLLQKHAVNLALNKTPKDVEGSSTSQSQKLDADIFNLPPLPEHLSAALCEPEQAGTWEKRMEKRDDIFSNFEDIGLINTESEDFISLPAEIKHELLTEIKDHSRRTHWAKSDEMPEDSNEFSKYQLNRLMKNSRLTQHLNRVRKELTAKASGEIAMDVVGNEIQGLSVEASRVFSEDSSHYFLIKGLRNLPASSEKIDESDLLKRDDLESVRSESFRHLHYANDDDNDDRPCWKNEVADPVQNVSRKNQFTTQNAVENIGLSDQETSSDDDNGDEDSPSSKYKRKMPLMTHVDEKKPKFDDDSKEQNLNRSEEREKETVEEMNARLFSFSESTKNESHNLPTGSNACEVNELLLKSSTEFHFVPESLCLNQEGPEEISESASSDDEDEGFIEVEPDSVLDEHVVIPIENVTPDSELKDVKCDAEHSVVERVEDIKEPELLPQSFEDITQGELWKIQETLENETHHLRQERGKQERLATSITDQMQTEAQELLNLFGVPYLISPMEAEAQCAYLDLTNQTQGTVTDDSDIWLFGGRCVYRNMFNQNRDVELYNLVDIKSRLLLEREDFINLALLCGSDYTEGIPGVGPVTGVEILAEFRGNGIEGLMKFREWWDEAQKQTKLPQETKIKYKIRNLKLSEGFPNSAVFDAYQSPTVDDSMDPFSWSMPDLDLLRQYGVTKLGWNRSQVDELLLPIMKSLNKPETQSCMKDFFLPDSKKEKRLKSSRLRNVINRIRSKNDEQSSEISDIAKQSKGKATKGLKTKNSKSSKGGGFVSSSKQTPSEVNLSEESSDESKETMEMEDEYEISDDVLASIDIDSHVQNESSSTVNVVTNAVVKKYKSRSAKSKNSRKSKLC